MIDFHSHILPCIDDGSASVEHSIEMLSMMSEQGITRVVATPHFTGDCTVCEFLEKRAEAYNALKAAIDASGQEFPEIILGAEVFITESTIDCEGLEKLCIEGTDCILVEMPLKYWEPFLYHVLYSMSAQHKLKIMIAHIDRYFSSLGRNENVMKLVNMQPVFQINTAPLKSHRGRKLLKWMLRLDAKVVFGSDSHNTTYRKPSYDLPFKIVSKKFGDEFLSEVDCFGNKILNNELL